LDGEAVTLSDPEQVVADEVRRDEMLLDVPASAASQRRAVAGAQQRMTVALTRPRRRKRILSIVTVAEAVAVAALLVMSWTVHVVSNGGQAAPLVNVYVQAAAELETIDELDILQDELDRLQADLIVAPALHDSGRFEMESLEEQFNNLYLFEPVDAWTEG